jgi:hypothetical protein
MQPSDFASATRVTPQREQNNASPFQEKDKVSPPSVVGAAGLIANNGSRVLLWWQTFT